MPAFSLPISNCLRARESMRSRSLTYEEHFLQRQLIFSSSRSAPRVRPREAPSRNSPRACLPFNPPGGLLARGPSELPGGDSHV